MSFSKFYLKFSAYKEKQWKNENKSHIAETYSRYYQTNKEEILKKQGITYSNNKHFIINQEHCEIIRKLKTVYKNDIKLFIESCYKKSRKSNIESNNSCIAYYTKELKKIKTYCIGEEDKCRIHDIEKDTIKRIQNVYNDMTKSIQESNKKAKELENTQDWQRIGKVYVQLISTFFSDKFVFEKV